MITSQIQKTLHGLIKLMQTLLKLLLTLELMDLILIMRNFGMLITIEGIGNKKPLSPPSENKAGKTQQQEYLDKKKCKAILIV